MCTCSLFHCISLVANQMGSGERSVIFCRHSITHALIIKTYEVIGSPPNVSVPTHFAKVVLAARPSSPSTPDVPESSIGAFVLPNAAIPDDAPLESFVLPGEQPSMATKPVLILDDSRDG